MCIAMVVVIIESDGMVPALAGVPIRKIKLCLPAADAPQAGSSRLAAMPPHVGRALPSWVALHLTKPT
jgi:hypothetical protein